VVDIQFSPANSDWETLRVATIAAEDRGYGAVFVFDHLAGVALDGSTMLESFALLGALSQITRRVELGTMVANVWNRQVGTLVSAAASVAMMSGRQFHLGVGAGAAPDSTWAAEQTAVGADLEATLDARHARVRAVLDLAARQWTGQREDQFSTFPRPTPPPTRLVGVNSAELSRVAGEHADGINVPWHHPRRDQFIAAANSAAGDRPFLRTAYSTYHPDLLDPEHPDRIGMDEQRIDRLVLAVFDRLDGWLSDAGRP
jgi:alkanesulfonate monooxygenase SsuD/methylene tetrahydromethanopterin reductase-like flavin-dependent oxidoreductase (luciferase family)